MAISDFRIRLLRIYDTRSLDRVAQIQHSINELELLGADGNIQQVHRFEKTLRYFYNYELALLLQAAGFAYFEIYGEFPRRPLTREDDAVIVDARKD